METFLKSMFSMLLAISPTLQELDYTRYRYLDISHCSIEFSLQSNSPIGCAVLCDLTEPCLSYFYGSSDSTCKGCRRKLGSSNSSQTNTDLEYYGPTNLATYDEECSQTKPCIDDENTVCTSGTQGERCVCDSQFMFHPTTRLCVTECQSYGSTFERYPFSGLPGPKGVVQNVSHVDECLELCASDLQPFVCVNIDYKLATKECRLSDITTANSQEPLKSNHEYDFYVRNCS